MTAEERLWKHVNKDGDCWIWTASVNTGGYGQIRVGNGRKLAHRFAWELLVGPIPDNMDLDHICHFRACVNPKHLRIATRSENIANQTLHRDSGSGLKGASWNKNENKWASQIVVNYHRIFLGYFTTAQLAHEAYMNAARHHFGEFANSG